MGSKGIWDKEIWCLAVNPRPHVVTVPPRRPGLGDLGLARLNVSRRGHLPANIQPLSLASSAEMVDCAES